VTSPFQTDIAHLRDRETCPYTDKKRNNQRLDTGGAFIHADGRVATEAAWPNGKNRRNNGKRRENY
jgi:hypothetical protein